MLTADPKKKCALKYTGVDFRKETPVTFIVENSTHGGRI